MSTRLLKDLQYEEDLTRVDKLFIFLELIIGCVVIGMLIWLVTIII